jgi:hypothetical protein
VKENNKFVSTTLREVEKKKYEERKREEERQREDTV